jgi:uncharacterized protein YcbX
MTGRLDHIWRHPIKSHGREELSETTLSAGECLPWDRRWAVAHERSCFDIGHPRWQPCQEFSIGAKSPRLQAIRTLVDARLGKLTLSHPDRVDITIDPDNGDDANRFIQWVMPISNGSRMLPARLVRGSQAMTDTDYRSVSIINLASHREVEAELGKEISPLRWRGNLLVDGLTAWAERDLIGKRLRVGAAELEIRENIVRCMATTANTDTGERDADTLGALKTCIGAQDMGVYAVVVSSGEIRQGDPVEVV